MPTPPDQTHKGEHRGARSPQHRPLGLARPAVKERTSFIGGKGTAYTARDVQETVSEGLSTCRGSEKEGGKLSIQYHRQSAAPSTTVGLFISSSIQHRVCGRSARVSADPMEVAARIMPLSFRQNTAAQGEQRARARV